MDGDPEIIVLNSMDGIVTSTISILMMTLYTEYPSYIPVSIPVSDPKGRYAHDLHHPPTRKSHSANFEVISLARKTRLTIMFCETVLYSLIWLIFRSAQTSVIISMYTIERFMFQQSIMTVEIDGHKYVGYWDHKNGLPEGHGTLYFADGYRYEGQWGGGQQNGIGTLYMTSGDVYTVTHISIIDQYFISNLFHFTKELHILYDFSRISLTRLIDNFITIRLLFPDLHHACRSDSKLFSLVSLFHEHDFFNISSRFNSISIFITTISISILNFISI